MAQGTIIQLANTGFGFIDYGTGQDLFFHRSSLDNVTFETLRRLDRVEFDLAYNPRGRGECAVHVRRIDAQSH